MKYIDFKRKFDNLVLDGYGMDEEYIRDLYNAEIFEERIARIDFSNTPYTEDIYKKMLELKKRLNRIDANRGQNPLLFELGMYLDYPITMEDLNDELTNHITNLAHKRTLKEFKDEFGLFRILVKENASVCQAIDFGEKLLKSSIIDESELFDEMYSIKQQLSLELESYRNIEKGNVLKHFNVEQFYQEIITNSPARIDVERFEDFCNFLNLAIHLKFREIDIPYLIEKIEQFTCIYIYQNDDILYKNLKQWLQQMKEKSELDARKELCQMFYVNDGIEEILVEKFNKIQTFIDYSTFQHLYEIVLLASKANLECLPFLVQKLTGVLIFDYKPEDEYNIKIKNLFKINNKAKKL